MNYSIRQELLAHTIETIGWLKDQQLATLEDLHFHAFNEDHYIIGYHQATEWLKKHHVSAWDAIESVLDWEVEVLGEVSLKPADMNSERIVNLYIYVLGEELLSEFDLVQEPNALLEELKKELGA